MFSDILEGTAGGVALVSIRTSGSQQPGRVFLNEKKVIGVDG